MSKVKELTTKITDEQLKLLQEQQNIEYDRKFWNARQRKTMNKRARYNTTFGEQNVSPSADFQTPTTHAFPPIMSAFRNGLVHVLGERANNLSAEGKSTTLVSATNIVLPFDISMVIPKISSPCLGLTTFLSFSIEAA